MNFDEINQQFEILCAPNQQSDKIEQANAFIMQFKTTPDCLVWIFQTYQLQPNKNARYHQLIILKQWCEQWGIINENPEIKTNIQQLLFTRECHEPFRQDPQFLRKLADAQLHFMWHAYPAEWPSFWADYFAAFDAPFIIQFMLAISNFTTNLSAANQLIYNTIKDTLREDQTDAHIAQFVIETMMTFNKDSFIAFHSLCKWVNVAYIINDQTLQCIKQGLSTPELSALSLRIISSLVKRGMPAENKIQLIQLFEIPTQIQAIGESIVNDAQIGYAASDLINNVGLVLLSLESPEVEQYFSMAIYFFSMPNADISLAVVPFLTSLCKANPETFQVITEALITRISLYFEHLETSPSQDVFLECLIPLEKAIANSTKSPPSNTSLELIKAMWDSEDIFATNPLKAISIICFISEVFSPTEHNQYISDFFERFYNIISFPPPYNLVLSYGMIQFIKFFSKVGRNFPEETISMVFNRLAELAVSTELTQPELEIENEIEEDMASMVEAFLNKIPKVVVGPDVIFNFLITQKDKLIAASGTLIQNLTDTKQQVFDQCLEQLNQHLQQNSEHAPEILPTIFLFLKSVKFADAQLDVTQAHAFIVNFIEPCSTDDNLLSLLIRAAYSCLGPHCYEIIMSSVQYMAAGYKTAGAICDAGEYLLQLESKEWIGPFIDSLTEPILTAFTSVQNWELQKNAEQQDIMALVKSFIHIFTSSLQYMQFLNPETYKHMKEFLMNALTYHFDIPELIESIVDFIAQMLKNDAEAVFTEFSSAALNIFLNENFDPTKRPWPNVCKRILKLHREMMGMDEEKAKVAIGNAFNRFNATMEYITKYFEIVTLKLPRETTKAGMEWIVNFANTRKLME